MRKGVVRRLEALERAAEKELLLSNGWVVALAYFLGGARRQTEISEALTRALGYPSLKALCEELVQAVRGSPMALQRRDVEAQRRLLKQFDYDWERSTPAALDEGLYKIIKSLPEHWIAWIKSENAKARLAEAEADEVWEAALQLLRRKRT